MFAEISVAVGNRHMNVQVNYTAMFAWLCLIYLVMVDWLGTLEVKKAVDGYKGGGGVFRDRFRTSEAGWGAKLKGVRDTDGDNNLLYG